MLSLVIDNTSTIAPTLIPDASPVHSPDTERALADEAAARAAGFSLRPPVYAIGTAVNATGEKNFRQSRREFEALPFATDACGDLAARVEAERRCDTLVDAPTLNMLPGEPMVDVDRAQGGRALGEVAGAPRRDQSGKTLESTLRDGQGPELAGQAAVGGEVSGRVKITVPAAAVPLVLEGLLPGFVERHPNVDVDVCVDDGFVDIVSQGYDATGRRILAEALPNIHPAAGNATQRHEMISHYRPPARFSRHRPPETRSGVVIYIQYYNARK